MDRSTNGIAKEAKKSEYGVAPIVSKDFLF